MTKICKCQIAYRIFSAKLKNQWKLGFDTFNTFLKILICWWYWLSRILSNMLEKYLKLKKWFFDLVLIFLNSSGGHIFQCSFTNDIQSGQLQFSHCWDNIIAINNLKEPLSLKALRRASDSCIKVIILIAMALKILEIPYTWLSCPVCLPSKTQKLLWQEEPLQET